MYCLADGQVQGDNRVAALFSRKLLRVITRGVVDDTVPCVAIADLLRELGVHSFTDSEVQHGYRVAAVH